MLVSTKGGIVAIRLRVTVWQDKLLFVRVSPVCCE